MIRSFVNAPGRFKEVQYMEENIGPGFKELAAHNFVYSLGNVSHWDIAAKLVTSPLIRRLQSIHYFSDLQQILQTTYEQHVQGTSCLVQFYASSVAAIWANMEEKLLKASDSQHGEQATTSYVKVYREYETRMKKVSPLPSLIGMIAAPPYRRPFGTYIKRDYMRLLASILRNKYLQHLLQQSNQSKNVSMDKIADNIISYLNIIKDEIINIYEKIINSEYIRFLPCIEKTLKLTEEYKYPSPFSYSQILNDYKKLLIESIKKEINNIFYIIDLLIKNIVNIDRSDLEFIHLLPSAFLLRYRTLSTILGFAYVYYEILNNINNRIKKNNKIDNYIYEDLDAILQVLDAMTVNFMTTLLLIVEINNIKINNNNIYYLSPLGAPEVMILLPFLASQNISPDKKASIIANHISPFVAISVEDAKSCSQFRKSCIFYKNNININKNYINKYQIINRKLHKDFPHEILVVPSTLWKPEIYRYLRTAYCCVLTARREDYGECPLSWSEGLGILGEELATSFVPTALGIQHMVNKSRRPFITYSMMTMIQSDMLPSAFQLDLLHRLTKDINMGLKISPLNIDDLVLNIDLYSMLVVDLLNAVYTHVFKDPATIAKRAGLMIAGDRLHGECPCYRKIDVLAALYFLLLSKEYYEYYKNINNKIKEIKETIKNVEGSLQVILEAAKSLARLLESLSKLLRLLVQENLKRKTVRDCRQQNPASECIEKLENAFNSFLGFSDIGVHQYLEFSLPVRKQNSQQDESRLLYHGIITLQTLTTLLQEDDPAKNNPNYIARTLLILFQTAYSKGLENAIKNEINKILKNKDINSEVEKVILLIPTQGIVKTYFHLPVEIPGGPIIVDAMKLKPPKTQDTPLQKMDNIEQKIFKPDKSPKDYLELTETLPTILQDPQTRILPDTTLWTLSGPREDYRDNQPLILGKDEDKKEEEKKKEKYNVAAEPKLVYKLNLIYSIIIKTKIDNALNEEEMRYIILKSLINILKQIIYNKK